MHPRVINIRGALMQKQLKVTFFKNEIMILTMLSAPIICSNTFASNPLNSTLRPLKNIENMSDAFRGTLWGGFPYRV